MARGAKKTKLTRADLKRHKRVTSKKWIGLKKRGLTPPESGAENRRRAKEAHGY